MPVATADKKGLMSSSYYRNCVMHNFSNYTFVNLGSLLGNWNRLFVTVSGMCHSVFISFIAVIFTDGTNKIRYYFRTANANRDLVRMYEKDNSVYLFFPSVSQPFTGLIQSSSGYQIIKEQPDDTYTEISIE